MRSSVEAEIQRLIKLGNSRSMAEILAYRTSPGVHGTDTRAFADAGNLERQLGKHAQRVCEAAQKHGYTPNPNDMYNPTFARFEGDPQAFASQGEGLGHFLKLAEDRGTGCMGSVNMKARERDPSKVKKKKLANDLVAKHMEAKFQKNPDLRFTADRKELAHQISEEHGNIRG